MTSLYTKHIIRFISLFLLFPSGIIFAADTVAIIMDDSFEKERTWSEVRKILISLEEGQKAHIFNSSHNEVTDFIVDYNYSKKTWNKAFRAELVAIAKSIKAMKHHSALSGDFDRHLRFLYNLKNEFSASSSDPDKQFEGIILSEINDNRLTNLSAKFPNIELEGLIYNNKTPFYVEDNQYEDTVVHVQYPNTNSKGDTSSSNTKNCRFWRAFIEKGGGKLGSCQSRELGRRIFKPELYGQAIDPDKLNLNIEKILGNGMWVNGIYVMHPLALVPPTSIVTTSNAVAHQKSTEKHSLPLSITLKWEGEADLDLSIWSDEGRLHFGHVASFGTFSHNSNNSETITLKAIPKKGRLRIVHSNGVPPISPFLIVDDNSFRHSEDLSGHFTQTAFYRIGEYVYEITLEQILRESPKQGKRGVKPAYSYKRLSKN